jgi:hypothetical protein
MVGWLFARVTGRSAEQLIRKAVLELSRPRLPVRFLELADAFCDSTSPVLETDPKPFTLQLSRKEKRIERVKGSND